MARIPSFLRALAAITLCVSVAAVPAPALAQDNLEEARLRKIEAEIRALQRKVFPGGDTRYFEPEIAAGETARTTTTTPSTTAVTDILARLDALEAQLQRLTARTEENSKIRNIVRRRQTASSGPKGVSDFRRTIDEPSICFIRHATAFLQRCDSHPWVDIVDTDAVGSKVHSRTTRDVVNSRFAATVCPEGGEALFSIHGRNGNDRGACLYSG